MIKGLANIPQCGTSDKNDTSKLYNEDSFGENECNLLFGKSVRLASMYVPSPSPPPILFGLIKLEPVFPPPRLDPPHCNTAFFIYPLDEHTSCMYVCMYANLTHFYVNLNKMLAVL